MARPTDWWRPIRNWLRMVRRRSARVTVDLLAHSAGGGDVIAQVAYPFHCRVSASSVDLVETRRRPPGPVLWRLGEAGGS
jgi:hypothetical protein